MPKKKGWFLPPFTGKGALTMTVALGSFSQVLLSIKMPALGWVRIGALPHCQPARTRTAVRHCGEPETEPLLTDKFHQRQKSWVMSPSDFQESKSQKGTLWWFECEWPQRHI